MKHVCASDRCTKTFGISDEDLSFYDRISPVFRGEKNPVPPPTLCPDCRMQRRLAFRNERTLHHRNCDSTGKSIVSMYAAEAPFPVYENEEWWKDGWSGLQYGREWDETRPFFPQFAELLHDVPKMARVQQGENINSRYTNCTSNNKNCHLLFSSNGNEDCLYGTWVNNSVRCIDCHQVLRSELCYECIDCVDCYACMHVRDSAQCSDSAFLVSCIGCKHCFGCAGLRQKEYCIFNEQYTKEEYAKKMEELSLEKASVWKEVIALCAKSALDVPVKHCEGVQNERVTGNHVTQSKNAFECFDSNRLEDCKWCTNAQFFKDSYDVSYYGSSGANELVYEAEGVGHGVTRVLFSKLTWGGCSDLLYCFEYFACRDCFGCTGLKHARCCILNKQYTQEEYEELVPRIIAAMERAGEWGEFFPSYMSPFGYDETVAQEYFPLTEEEALSRGLPWSGEEEEESEKYMGPAHEVPDAVHDVTEDIVTWILRCTVTGKPYKITPQELVFYRDMHIPVPRMCPDQRHKDRMARRNPRTLWDRTCANCSKAIRTSYAPDRPETVYCEECYLKEVY